MLRKSKFYLLLFIITASTVVGLLNVLPTFAQTVTKDPNILSSTLTNELKNDIFGQIMGNCLRNGLGGVIVSGAIIDTPITKDSIAEGSWLHEFANNNFESKEKDALRAGYIVDSGDDGKLSCINDAQAIISGYKTAAGLSSADNYTVICTLGFRPVVKDGGTDPYKYVGNDNMTIADCVNFAKDPNVKGYRLNGNHMDGTDYTIPAEEQYVAYSYTLFNICKPTSGADRSVILADVPVVYMDASVENITYSMPDGSGDQQAKWDVSVTPDEKPACKDLPGLMQNTYGAYQKWLSDHPDEEGTTGTVTPKTDEEKSTCNITGVGWIVCPVFSFLASATDSVYSILDRVFLKLPPVNMALDDEANGLYRSWKIMRDIANVVFVIAFIIIVLSQLTSLGISSYGLKRLVPKLVVSVILVNVSYFLCAFAVDFSNIIGSSLRGLLDGASNGILTSGSETAWSSGGGFRSMVATALITATAAAALTAWATLPLVGAAILIVLPIILAVLITMIVRQALVVLLIVISPLAFVALLLPNTEGYFKKWRELFQAMLLIYPVVSLVFGASALASTVLEAAAKDTGELAPLYGIAAAAVRVLPLLFIPALMKISSGVFGRVTGIVNNRQKGWFDNARNTRLNNHKYDQAQKGSEIGDFVNRPNRATGLLGGAGSRRRRAIGSLTPYGSNVRGRAMKDRISETESTNEQTYLDGNQGVEARNAAKNAQVGLHDAEIHAETIRLSSPEGMILQQESLQAETLKQTAENRAQTAAINSIPAALAADARQTDVEKQTADDSMKTRGALGIVASPGGRIALRESEMASVNKQTAEDASKSIGLTQLSSTAEGQIAVEGAKNAELIKTRLENNVKATALGAADQSLKVQATTSANTLANIEGLDKQVYEELAAAGSSDPGLLTVHGVSPVSANAAQDSSFQAKAISSATGTARSEGESQFSERINVDPSLLGQAGGNVNRVRGESRARAQAAATISKDSNEAVENETRTMMSPRTAVNPAMAARMGSTGPDLQTIYQDNTLSPERRAAAAIMTIQRGEENDIRNLINYMGTAPLDPDMIDIQQHAASKLSGRKPTVVGAGTMAEIADGRFHPRTSAVGGVVNSPVDELTEGRIMSGKLTPSALAATPPSDVDDIIRVINHSANSATLRSHSEFIKLKDDILDYLTTPQLEGQRPSPEMVAKLEAIAHTP